MTPGRGARSRGSGRVAGAVAGVVLLATPGPLTPAVAGDDDGGAVLLSADGRTWASDLDVPLLPTGAWVPGETRRAALLVRNGGPGAAHGELAATVDADAGDDPAGTAALAEALQVRVRPDEEPGDGLPGDVPHGEVPATGGRAPVRLAEAATVPVTLEVTLPASAGDETQGATVLLDVLVTLVGERGPTGDDGTDDGQDDEVGARDPADGADDAEDFAVRDGGAEALPRTGPSAAVAVAAVLAVTAGVLLRLVRPRGGERRG